ncbi:hypothetical protein [Roseateles sp.]|uniref:hypothetical protein n=1 Tax=Roseateles sp. TaxID=1971397 RepID=UPI003BA67429
MNTKNLGAKPALISLLAAAAMVACGGGGGGLSPYEAPMTMSISGSAFNLSGAAIASAPVNVKCAGAKASGTTAADGSFSIPVAGGALPCMLQVQLADGSTLYSMNDGSGVGGARANITPLTDMVVAKALGVSNTPAAAFASYAPVASATAATGISNAQSIVTNALSGLRLNVGTETMGGAISSSDIRALGAALSTAKVSLAQLENAIVVSQQLSGPTTSSALVSNLMTSPSTSCPTARNGSYIVIDQRGNASTVTLTWSGNNGLWTSGSVTAALTAVANDACHFTGTGSDTLAIDLVLSSIENIASYRKTSTTVNDSTIGLMIPNPIGNTVALTDLAGSWNRARFVRASGTAMSNFNVSDVTIAADGAFTNKECTSVAGTFDCNGAATGNSSTGKFAADSASASFKSSIDSQLAYPVRTSDGGLMLVKAGAGSNGIEVLSKRTALVLPGVGKATAAWSNSGSVSSANLALFTSTAMAAAKTVTVTAADAAANSYTSDDGFSLSINKPLPGNRYRPVAGASKSQVQMRAGGMLTVFGSEKTTTDTTASFGFSIDK